MPKRTLPTVDLDQLECVSGGALFDFDSSLMPMIMMMGPGGSGIGATGPGAALPEAPPIDIGSFDFGGVAGIAEEGDIFGGLGSFDDF